MLFTISQTRSDYLEGNSIPKQPHKKAWLKAIARYDTRTCSEEYYNAHIKGKKNALWKAEGTNHTVTKSGGIRRKMGTEKVWVIAFATLEDLIKFVSNNGECIISPKSYNNLPSIEIYNDYRE